MNLTIKARLLFAFTLLVAISGVIYFIGAKNTETLNDRVNQIINVNSNRMILSVKISEDVQFMTAREKELVMTRDNMELQELSAEFDKRQAEFEERVEALKLIVDERGMEFVNDFTANWEEYLKDHRKIRNMAVNVNTDSASQIAAQLSKTTARESAGRAVTAVNRIIKKNEAELATVQANTDELYATGKTNMLISLLVAVAVAIAIAYWIINSISTSIAKAKVALQAVANGDLTVEIDNNSKDEIGELLRHLESMVEKVKDVISSVTSAANNIASASEQMSGSSQQMSEGATEQAASAEEVSSSMEEMAANIQQNTDNAQQTERIAMKAAEDVQEGSRVVNQTVDSMKKIAEKITIIGEIARQTNLLALNAAVEAARAGEHGKGFAVVAAEVRKLAERSQLAANEINDLSSSSVSVAEKSGKLLEQIVPNIQNTSRLVQEISASSMEQNAGAEQVNNAIQQLNQVIQQNAAAAEEMASSSEELSSQASQLQDTVEFFNVGNKRGRAAGPAKVKHKQVINLSNTGASKLNVKKNASSQTGLNLDLSSKDSLDTEFERF